MISHKRFTGWLQISHFQGRIGLLLYHRPIPLLFPYLGLLSAKKSLHAVPISQHRVAGSPSKSPSKHLQHGRALINLRISTEYTLITEMQGGIIMMTVMIYKYELQHAIFPPEFV